MALTRTRKMVPLNPRRRGLKALQVRSKRHRRKLQCSRKMGSYRLPASTEAPATEAIHIPMPEIPIVLMPNRTLAVRPTRPGALISSRSSRTIDNKLGVDFQ